MLYYDDTFEMLPKQIQSTPKKYNSSPLGGWTTSIMYKYGNNQVESVGQLEQKLSHKIISTWVTVSNTWLHVQCFAM